MAKTNRRNQQYSDIQQQQQKAGGEYDAFMNQFLGRPTGTTPTANRTYDAKGGSNKSGGGLGLFGAAGALLGKNRGHQSSQEDAGTSGPTNLDSPRYRQLMEAGDDERGYLTSGLRGFSETGGMSPDDIANMRSAYGNIGGPAAVNLSDFAKEKEGYGNLIDTGGYTDKDTQRIRAQAASSAPSLFGALKGQMDRSRAAGGANMSPTAGFDFKNARAAAQQAGSDKLNANIGLAESIRSGKQAGLAGLTGIDTTTGNQSLDKAGQENQFNLGKANLGTNIEGQIAGMQQQGKQFGLSGLQNLYGQDYAPGRNFEQTWLNAIGAQDQSNRGGTALSLQNDETNRSKAMENIIGITGAVAGGLTGLGGISNMIGGASKMPAALGGMSNINRTGMIPGQSNPGVQLGPAPMNPYGMNIGSYNQFQNPYQQVSFGGGRY